VAEEIGLFDAIHTQRALPRNEAEARTMVRNDAAASRLAEHLHEVPVLILCCLQHDGSPSDINGDGPTNRRAVEDVTFEEKWGQRWETKP
jgi:hypothetical protein